MPLLRGKIVKDAPLAKKTWLGVGGPAEFLYIPADEDDLHYFLSTKPNLPLTVLGGCSNVLIRDGGIPGVYHVDGLPVTPYLVPQECGMHMDTRWVEIERDTQLSNVRQGGVSTLRIEQAGKPFAFSCLPYTAGALENATHQEELPPARRTVLCVCGAVRGVGGINSWGADVQPPYHISGEGEIAFSFDVKPE